jgi:hypothetical protein
MRFSIQCLAADCRPALSQSQILVAIAIPQPNRPEKAQQEASAAPSGLQLFTGSGFWQTIF